MQYRESKSNIIRDVPEALVLNDRDRFILECDAAEFEEGGWEAVTEAVNERFPNETIHSVRGVKRRFMNKVRNYMYREIVNNNLEDSLYVPDRDVAIPDRKQIAFKWLGSTHVSHKNRPSEATERRICVVSDYHGQPHSFIQESLLNEQYDVCVHAGDIFDMQTLSKPRMEGKSIAMQEKTLMLDEEIQNMRLWFELLDEHTNAQHVVLMGNHDARMYSLFARLLDPYLKTDSLLYRLFNTPLDIVTEGLENFILGQRDMEWHYPDLSIQHAANSQYLYQVGDVLVSHMDFTGKTPGQAVNALWGWVQDYMDVLAMHDIRVAMQAHTHKLSLDRNCQGGHVALVETGCAMSADRIGYSLVYKGHWTPSAVGYVLLDQYLEDDVWTTDLDSIKLKGIG